MRGVHISGRFFSIFAKVPNAYAGNLGIRDRNVKLAAGLRVPVSMDIF